MKKKLISAIKQKENQLSQLKVHMQKSEICSDLYDKILIEKAILVKQLKDLQEYSLVNKIKNIIPHKEKLICDYFAKG